MYTGRQTERIGEVEARKKQFGKEKNTGSHRTRADTPTRAHSGKEVERERKGTQEDPRIHTQGESKQAETPIHAYTRTSHTSHKPIFLVVVVPCHHHSLAPGIEENTQRERERGREGERERMNKKTGTSHKEEEKRKGGKKTRDERRR